MDTSPAVDTVAAAAVVKTVLSIVRMGYKPPKWVTPFAALLLGPAVLYGMAVSQGAVVTPAVFASVLLGGVAAAGLAVGMHEMGQKAKS